mmetsp:Transcript_52647/g.146660  ORF Transcript_52647/g.146660 Transcript_52647/m.146660 type:complete len:205 (+) Transcript_52647:104-718(+)
MPDAPSSRGGHICDRFRLQSNPTAGPVLFGTSLHSQDTFLFLFRALQKLDDLVDIELADHFGVGAMRDRFVDRRGLPACVIGLARPSVAHGHPPLAVAGECADHGSQRRFHLFGLRADQHFDHLVFFQCSDGLALARGLLAKRCLLSDDVMLRARLQIDGVSFHAVDRDPTRHVVLQRLDLNPQNLLLLLFFRLVQGDDQLPDG